MLKTELNALELFVFLLYHVALPLNAGKFVAFLRKECSCFFLIFHCFKHARSSVAELTSLIDSSRAVAPIPLAVFHALKTLEPGICLS